MNNYIVFVAIALFWTWEQRNKRWGGVLGALSGKYAIPPAPPSTGSATYTGSTTPGKNVTGAL